jgi:hypothetical protein
LLAAGGAYAQMWERQQARRDERLGSAVSDQAGEQVANA